MSRRRHADAGTPLTATVSVEVPGQAERTCCRVQVWAAGGDRPPVAVLSEIPENPGLSVDVAFPFVAQKVRSMLPPGAAEPVWIERWAARAVAAVLLERSGPPTDMLVCGVGGAWIRTPLPPGALDALLQGKTVAPAQATRIAAGRRQRPRAPR